MLELFRTALYPALLFAGVVIAGPLLEEFLFRGFIFAGIEKSEAGPAGAVIITSIVWSAIHFQYDLYARLVIFALGIAFGIARWKSRSMLLTFVLHALVNLVAMIHISYLA